MNMPSNNEVKKIAYINRIEQAVPIASFPAVTINDYFTIEQDTVAGTIRHVNCPVTRIDELVFYILVPGEVY